MKHITLVVFLILQTLTLSLEGKWKLTKFTAMEAILNSQQFINSTDEQRIRVMESMDFTLDNTFYEFKGDSIFYTNAGGDMQLSQKTGKFLVQSDTLIIFPSDKVNPIKFFLSSYEKEEFEMKVVYKDGSLGPSVMTFGRVK